MNLQDGYPGDKSTESIHKFFIFMSDVKFYLSYI